MVKSKCLNLGGVPTTLENSGQQWDFPNIWPPLEHIIVRGTCSPRKLYFLCYQDKCIGGIKYVKNRFKRFQCDHMIHTYSIPSQSLLPSSL